MRSIFLLCLSILGLAACSANYHSIFQQVDLNRGSLAVSVDAKQRMMFLKNGLVCVEPSPDALSVISAAFSNGTEFSLFGGTGKQAELASRLAGATSESGANIGLRTQTIQLMRDGMFRLCEGFLNGALDRTEYNRLMRKYQNVMMAILAIEQLTGATKGPNVVLTSSASARTGGDIVLLQENLDKAKEELKKAVENLKELEVVGSKAKDVANATDAEALTKELETLKQGSVAADTRLKTAEQVVKDKKSELEKAENGKRAEAEKALADANIERQKAQDNKSDIEKKAADKSAAVAKAVEADKQLEKANTEISGKKKEVAEKEANVTAIEKKIDDARKGGVDTAASAQQSQCQECRPNAAIVESMSTYVYKIIREITRQSFTVDDCISFLIKREDSKSNSRVGQYCEVILLLGQSVALEENQDEAEAFKRAKEQVKSDKKKGESQQGSEEKPAEETKTGKGESKSDGEPASVQGVLPSTGGKFKLLEDFQKGTQRQAR